MIEINRNPSRRDLFVFGALMAVFFAVVGTFAWRSDAPRLAAGLWIGGGALTVSFALVRPFRVPIYLGWCYAAYPIGWTVSHVVLAITYYVLITAVGLVLRLAGRRPLPTSFDRAAPTYWVQREGRRDVSSYFRQY